MLASQPLKKGMAMVSYELFCQFNADIYCWVKIDGKLRDQASLNEFVYFNSSVTTLPMILGGITVNWFV